jgi:hypothetical protein
LLLLSGLLFRWLSSGIAQPGSCRTGSQSIGLGVDPRCVRRPAFAGLFGATAP